MFEPDAETGAKDQSGRTVRPKADQNCSLRFSSHDSARYGSASAWRLLFRWRKGRGVPQRLASEGPRAVPPPRRWASIRELGATRNLVYYTRFLLAQA